MKRPENTWRERERDLVEPILLVECGKVSRIRVKLTLDLLAAQPPAENR